MSGRAPLPAVAVVLVAAALASASCFAPRDEGDLQPPPGFAPPPVRPLRRNPPGSGRLGFGSGFFPLEVGSKGDSWRWMSSRGEARLRNPRARRTLQIVGHVPLELLKEPPTVRITVEGHRLDEFVQTQRPLAKEYLLTPDVLGSEPSVLVVIETNRTGRAPRDSRDLGISVERLGWDEAD